MSDRCRQFLPERNTKIRIHVRMGGAVLPLMTFWVFFGPPVFPCFLCVLEEERKEEERKEEERKEEERKEKEKEEEEEEVRYGFIKIRMKVVTFIKNHFH